MGWPTRNLRSSRGSVPHQSVNRMRPAFAVPPDSEAVWSDSRGRGFLRGESSFSNSFIAVLTKNSNKPTSLAEQPPFLNARAPSFTIATRPHLQKACPTDQKAPMAPAKGKGLGSGPNCLGHRWTDTVHLGQIVVSSASRHERLDARGSSTKAPSRVDIGLQLTRPCQSHREGYSIRRVSREMLKVPLSGICLRGLHAGRAGNSSPRARVTSR